MLQNYFNINGKIFYTGTVFIIQDVGKQKEASFICYDTSRSEFVYKIQNCRWHSRDKYFWKHFINVTDKIDKNVHMPTYKQRRDVEIDGLFLGWVWYIFLMLISVIFKDAIGFWILISVIFFSWRSKKIKEEGTYVEW